MAIFVSAPQVYAYIATKTKKPGILRYRASESGGYLLSIFLFCQPLSVRQKNVGTKRQPQDVRFTEHLIGGKKEKIIKSHKRKKGSERPLMNWDWESL